MEQTEQQTPQIDRDQNMWAMLCHLTTFSGFIIPFGNIIGPLIVWSLKKDQYPLVEDQGKEAINFQISVLIYLIISIILIFVVIGIPLLIALMVFDLITTVVATIRTAEGGTYRYPLSMRFIN
jgi:uncharacterized protein